MEEEKNYKRVSTKGSIGATEMGNYVLYKVHI